MQRHQHNTDSSIRFSNVLHIARIVFTAGTIHFCYFQRLNMESNEATNAVRTPLIQI